MRIVHVSVGGVPVLHPFGGAVQRRIIELAQRQVLGGHEVTVYSPGDRTRQEDHQGILIRYVKCRSGARLSWIELQLRAALDLARENVDLIHFHGQAEGAFLTGRIKAAKVLSYDYFYFRRGLRGPLHALYRRLLHTYDALLPVSEYCRDESDRFWDLHNARLRIVHNGVNTGQFGPDPAAGRRERERGGFTGRVVLYVGRVNEQKGTHVLIEAMRLLREQEVDVQLVVAGPIGQFGTGQADPEHWRERIEAVGGAYLGAVPEDRLSAVYNLADVFVMPTVQFEMFGMAAVEAQACGKPTIASDHGGLRETVPRDCGGRFPVGDSAELANQIAALLAADEATYDGVAARARANADTYSWPAVNDRLERVYREVVR
jgi:glycosyltransferase involved in cell wall biosynthesis